MQTHARILIIGLVLVTVSQSLAWRQPVGAASFPTYTMTDLGTLPGGSESAATSINATGQIVGYSFTASGSIHAVLWPSADENPVDLDTLGGSLSFAYDINDAGQVVGFSGVAGGYDAVLWPGVDENPVDLGTLPGGISSFAHGINDAGQVVGRGQAAFEPSQAVLWPGAGENPIALGSLSDRFGTEAISINAAGQIVGNSGTASGSIHAVLWPSADENPVDLDTLGGSESYAYGINDAGQVVGASVTASGALHAFLWPGADGKMIDLDSLLGGSFSVAYDINDAGQIVGSAVTASGDRHAFLLTPPSADLSVGVSSAPDPVTLGSLLTYTITVTNNGPAPTLEATLTDTLPDGVIVGQRTASQGSCSRLGRFVSCALGALSSGAIATIVIVVAPSTVGRVLNGVAVAGDVDDPDVANNQAAIWTFVMPEWKLPWSQGETWFLTSGPHCDERASQDICGDNQIRYALDFVPAASGDPVDHASDWVVLAATGCVRVASASLIEVDHGNGIRTGYYHLDDATMTVKAGQCYPVGTPIGKLATKSDDALGHDGKWDGKHLHFFVCFAPDSSSVCVDDFNNRDALKLPIAGVVLSGWSVINLPLNNDGQMTRGSESETREANKTHCALDKKSGELRGGCEYRSDLVSDNAVTKKPK